MTDESITITGTDLEVTVTPATATEGPDASGTVDEDDPDAPDVPDAPGFEEEEG